MKQGYSKLWEDDGFRKITKKTEFFEPGKFKPFEKDLANSNYRVHIRPENVKELIIQCSGYGYFQDQERSVQGQIKRNLAKYLNEATELCQNIKIFKLDLKGFSIQGHFLTDILDLICKYFKSRRHLRQKQRQKQKQIQGETVWIHTRGLRDCQSTDFTRMLQLVHLLVNINRSQEISVMMSSWEFKDNPLTYNQFQDILKQFCKRLKPEEKPFLKRLKIDISAWYVHDLEAYKFLTGTVSSRELEERLENSRHDPNSIEVKSAIKEEQLIQARSKIKEYIAKMDRRYQIQHPIAEKQPPYINEEKQFKTRRLEYFRRINRNGMNSKDRLKLLSWLDSDWGLPNEHRNNLDNISKEISQLCKQQRKKIQKDKQFVQEVQELEKFISQTFVRFPFEQVIKLRVTTFHHLILSIMSQIYPKLKALQQFEWDMRNWNRMFDMIDLKKELDKIYGNSAGLNIIDNLITATPKLLSIDEDQDQDEDKQGQQTLIMSFIL